MKEKKNPEVPLSIQVETYYQKQRVSYGNYQYPTDGILKHMERRQLPDDEEGKIPLNTD